MGFKDFHDKLAPFFSELAIYNLHQYAIESARDAFGDSGSDYDMAYEGHVFVCNLLWDYMEDYETAKRLIERLTKCEFTREQYDKLDVHMQEEW